MTLRNVVIIGSGPAGYTAAIYLSRAGLQPVMVTGALTPGGQLVNTTEVENYPGFPDGILGPDLMDAMKAQAAKFGTEFVQADVESVEAMPADGNDVPADKPTFRLTLDTGEGLDARAVIVATGSTYRKLGVPGEEKYSGHGVSYCATCDGFFFRDKPIVVVGGGDSAFEEALYLTRFGSSVTLIHRRGEFRASAIMVERARANEKLTLLTDTVVTAIHGGVPAATPSVSAASTVSTPAPGGLNLNLGGPAGGLSLGGGLSLPLAVPTAGEVTGIDIRNTVTGETGTLTTSAVFVAIGHTPATGFLGGLVDKDSDGYVLVDGTGTCTSHPGVFAAGDCVDRVYRQAISAAGMGCRAALDAQAYLA
ncbi:NAD(P)/FAD-dependent oxidoreductase [Bifidobacterium saguinibicoloris]|uniref:NAD(P)/FAD-dependent oxidoreductase n=1 Tax=Bifidobacterium saguinibicoloris TaxID=2834433 RepID=UPI001C58079A|nr:FAD-dependent oxidoreductase [Bifidobacterium saguinibicoloris]MBW3081379.1 FAD-dependent oxidoreductase [Bifidobacterium saguinibicoloris]